MSALGQLPLTGASPAAAWVSGPRAHRTARPFTRVRTSCNGASTLTEPHSVHSPVHRITPLQNLPGRDYGALDRTQYGLFVQFFRQASPYIEGHRGRTFVISIPGEDGIACYTVNHAQVLSDSEKLPALLEDISLLHGLGVKLVLVLGTPGFPEGGESSGEDPFRATDCEAMETLIQATGISKLQVEAFLSKAPLVALARRHTGKMGESSHAHSPMLTVVSGNYVAAKRRGVVAGVDLGASGTVRHVAGEPIAAQLAAGSVVLMTGLGFSAGGEALSCSPTAVATATAIALRADKLLLLTTTRALGPRSRALSGWLPLGEAESMLAAALSDSDRQAELAHELRGDDDGDGRNKPETNHGSAAADRDATTTLSSTTNFGFSSYGSQIYGTTPATWAGGDLVPPFNNTSRPPPRDLSIDLEKWAAEGPPLPLLAACAACRAGVKRAHLVDAARDGGLLLELYSRDGVGSMISTDLYEGIRPAIAADLPRIAELLRPLEDRGFLVRRTPAKLASELPDFIVWERDGRVLGCVAAHSLGQGVAELAAFAVHPAYRGLGKGDSLLEMLEARVKAQGLHTLVLLTTRTADWFRQRGFGHVGRAAGNAMLPKARRDAVDPGRNSQLYAKQLS